MFEAVDHIRCYVRENNKRKLPDLRNYSDTPVSNYHTLLALREYDLDEDELKRKAKY